MNRTTNVCEGYHHIINEKFRRGQPDPFQCVHFLQEQQADIERRVAQLQVGAPPRKRKAAYVHVDGQCTSHEIYSQGSSGEVRVDHLPHLKYIGGVVPNILETVCLRAKRTKLSTARNYHHYYEPVSRELRNVPINFRF
jgi:hypothetical protein